MGCVDSQVKAAVKKYFKTVKTHGIKLLQLMAINEGFLSSFMTPKWNIFIKKKSPYLRLQSTFKIFPILAAINTTCLLKRPFLDDAKGTVGFNGGAYCKNVLA